MSSVKKVGGRISVDNMMKINLGLEEGELKIETGPRNFVGYLPHTFRNVFTEGLDFTLRSHLKETGVLLKSEIFLGSACDMGTDSDIWNTESIDDFPDAVASVGFGGLFSRRFLSRFAKKESFRNVWAGPINSVLEGAGLMDPDGWFAIYAAQPFVMLVDRSLNARIPAALKWKDLLEPEFRGKIVLGGSDDPAEDVPLIYFYKEYGVEGLAKLAANVKEVRRACRIGSIAGSMHPDRAAVYILPWAYARACSAVEGVSVVWPEDGALINPLCLIVKAGKMEEVAPITRYVVGSKLGRQGVRCGLVSMNPNVKNGLPKGATFKWLGWDYIKSRDVAELRDRVHKLFVVMRRDALRKMSKDDR